MFFCSLLFSEDTVHRALFVDSAARVVEFVTAAPRDVMLVSVGYR